MKDTVFDKFGMTIKMNLMNFIMLTSLIINISLYHNKKFFTNSKGKVRIINYKKRFSSFHLSLKSLFLGWSTPKSWITGRFLDPDLSSILTSTLYL